MRTKKGTRLAVRIRGTGPALVLCNGWSTSDFFWKHMLPHWDPNYTVVSWDYPGHGASEAARVRADVDVAVLADHVRLVMNAAGLQCASLVGYSMGCQVVLEAAASMPDRIDAAIALLGSFEHMIGTATQPRLGPVFAACLERSPDWVSWRIHRALYKIMQTEVGIPLGHLLGLIGPDASNNDVRDYINHFGRVDGPSLIAMAVAGQRHSARPALPFLRAPVFIVTGEADPLAPPSRAGALLHALIPDSRLVALPWGTHTSLFEHPEELSILIDDFLLEAGVREAWAAAQRKSA